MSNYVILKGNNNSKESTVFVTAEQLQKYKGSITSFANEELDNLNSTLDVGDVIYELKPVLKIHAVVTASRVKNL